MRYISLVLLLFVNSSYGWLLPTGIIQMPNKTSIIWNDVPLPIPSTPIPADAQYYGFGVYFYGQKSGTPCPACIGRGWLSSYTSVPITATDTLASLNQKLLNKIGPSGSHLSDAYPNVAQYYVKACIMTSSFNSYASNLYPVAVGPCIDVPESQVTCDITPNSASIEHGTMDINNVNGNRSSITATVSCSGPVNVKVFPIAPTTDLGLGITSTITVNNQSVPQPITVIGQEIITITSTLSATNPSAGTFSGVSAIVVNVQ